MFCDQAGEDEAKNLRQMNTKAIFTIESNYMENILMMGQSAEFEMQFEKLSKLDILKTQRLKNRDEA